MRKNKFTIAEYSLIAAGFFTVNNIYAQVIYTDIDPDFILDTDLESEGVDLDNDGEYDFAFLQVSYYWTTSVFLDLVFYQRIWCGPQSTPANAVAGVDVFSGSYNRYYPYALSLGDTIDENLKFYNWGYQRMAFRTVNSLGGQNEGGYWYPKMQNHFLGVRFIDDAGADHYGWIRCSVLDTARVLVIKDYAYELQPDTPIIAGDTIGDTTTPVQTIEHITEGISVYAFHNTIYIHNSETFGEKLSISIYDLAGKLITNQHTTLQYTEIVVQASEGMYIVEVSSEKNMYRLKVFLK